MIRVRGWRPPVCERQAVGSRMTLTCSAGKSLFDRRCRPVSLRGLAGRCFDRPRNPGCRWVPKNFRREMSREAPRRSPGPARVRLLFSGNPIPPRPDRRRSAESSWACRTNHPVRRGLAWPGMTVPPNRRGIHRRRSPPSRRRTTRCLGEEPAAPATTARDDRRPAPVFHRNQGRRGDCRPVRDAKPLEPPTPSVGQGDRRWPFPCSCRHPRKKRGNFQEIAHPPSGPAFLGHQNGIPACLAGGIGITDRVISRVEQRGGGQLHRLFHAFEYRGIGLAVSQLG